MASNRHPSIFIQLDEDLVEISSDEAELIDISHKGPIVRFIWAGPIKEDMGSLFLGPTTLAQFPRRDDVVLEVWVSADQNHHAQLQLPKEFIVRNIDDIWLNSNMISYFGDDLMQKLAHTYQLLGKPPYPAYSAQKDLISFILMAAGDCLNLKDVESARPVWYFDTTICFLSSTCLDKHYKTLKVPQLESSFPPRFEMWAFYCPTNKNEREKFKQGAICYLEGFDPLTISEGITSKMPATRSRIQMIGEQATRALTYGVLSFDLNEFVSSKTRKKLNQQSLPFIEIKSGTALPEAKLVCSVPMLDIEKNYYNSWKKNEPLANPEEGTRMGRKL